MYLSRIQIFVTGKYKDWKMQLIRIKIQDSDEVSLIHKQYAASLPDGSSGVYFLCNKCKRLVDEDHICDYDISEYDFICNDNADNSDNIDNTDNIDFIERLISEVFIREPLWNSKLPYEQRNPKDIKSLWSEVDACLDIDPGTSKNKWTILRNRFMMEHFRNAYTARGSTWYLYKFLSFLKPTFTYEKTKSLENVNTNHQSMALIGESSFPSTSTQKHLSQQSVIKPQSSEYKKRFISELENDQSLKSTKRIKKSNIPADTRIEEALLKDLELTGPTKEQCQLKSDKIENFIKYIETYLHEMTPEISKRVMKQILIILLDEDII